MPCINAVISLWIAWFLRDWPLQVHHVWRLLRDENTRRVEDRWSLRNTACDSSLPPVVTFRKHGVNRLWRRGWPSFLPCSIPLNTVVFGWWSVAFSAGAEHESDSLYLYQSSVLSLHCVQGGLGFSSLQLWWAHQKGTGRCFCVCHFLGIRLFLSLQRGGEGNRMCFHAPKTVIGHNWQVGSRRSAGSPPSLRNVSKKRHSYTFLQHFHRALTRTQQRNRYN